jgi:hypothetical protein
MRFVVVQGVVLNTESIDMIVPQGRQSQVFLRGGGERVFDLPSEELMEHLRHNDDILRVVHEPAEAEKNQRAAEESA